jgi:hypothetical protein
MNYCALCALQSHPHPSNLSWPRRMAQTYAENCVLNTLLGMAQKSLQAQDSHVTALGIFADLEDAIQLCQEQRIDTLYVAVRRVPKQTVQNHHGIQVNYL